MEVFLKMSAEKQRLAMRAILIGQIIRNGLINPNSDEFESRIARLLSNPEFRGLGITLREMKEFYLELCREASSK